VADIQAVCAKWELTAVPVGRVTDDGLFRIVHDGVTVAAIPGERLVDGCPMHHPAAQEAPAAVARRAASPGSPARTDVLGALPLLLDDPTIASKRWVFEQYDSTVQAETVLAPGGDAGVLRVPGTGFGLAVSVDCNQRYVTLDPYQGGLAAVAEAARNVACTGAVPLGITDCLNFGNPDKPDVFYQFREACRGIADACRAFGTPVTGGNVSLYNESPTGAIDPTPTIGMVGLLRDVTRRVPSHFAAPGDSILLLGSSHGHLGGSSYWEVVHGFVGGAPPPVDLDREHRLQRLLAAAAERGLLHSAHDCADGGLAVALAEACIGEPYAGTPLGARVNLANPDGVAAPALLYGEDAGRVVVSCGTREAAQLRALAAEHGVPAESVGMVSGASEPLEVHIRDGHATLRWATPDPPPHAGGTRPGRGSLTCVESSESPEYPTPRGSRTSDSTPCSTAARRAPASSPSMPRPGPIPAGAWGWWARSSTEPT